MILSNSSSNFTAEPGNPVWSFSSWLTLIVCMSSLLFNGVTLAIFLKTPRLRIQPFYVYLMFLLGYNFLLAAVQNPLSIIDSLYKTWWLGKRWCIVYKYSGSVITALGMQMHVLVTFSRLWAITFPFSYRRIHSRSTAMFLSFCLFAYVHIIYMPEFAPKMVAIKSEALTNCRAQYSLSIPMQFFMYVGAILTILLAYPFILFKRKEREKERRARVAPFAASTRKTVPSRSEVILGGGINSFPQGSKEIPDDPAALQSTVRKANSRTYGFAVMTLLTCSAMVCWTPATVIFLVNSFSIIPYPKIFQTALTLFSMQPVLDPVLFTIALKDLRTGFREIVFRWHAPFSSQY